jgi:signal transduction histidine kinase
MFLLHQHLPEAQVVEAGGEDLEEVLASEPDLVLVNLESPLASRILRFPNAPKVIGIVDGARVARTAPPPELDGLLVRPFVPAELYRAVRRALGMRPPADKEVRPLERARRLTRYGLFGSVAVAAVLEVATSNVSTFRGALLGLAFLYAALRLGTRRGRRVWAWIDVVAAAGLIAATGGLNSNYMVFGLVASFGAGLDLGIWPGAGAGVLAADGSAYVIVQSYLQGTLEAQQAAAWFFVFPLIALAGGFAARIWRSNDPGSSPLIEANQVLSTLYRMTRTMPGGLEIGAVAEAALDEARSTLRAPGALLLAGSLDTFSLVGSYGLAQPESVVVGRSTPGVARLLEGGARVIRRGELHPPLAAALGHDCWLVAPLRRSGLAIGLLMAACADDDEHARNRVLLQQLAEETALAVENALLFHKVRTMSADEERRRLAAEMHDGVAQALTHLRFELDFMRRSGSVAPDAMREEIGRLAKVVDRASVEVRSMITGLRSSANPEGLTGSLRSYLSDLRGLGGPEIAFESRGTIHLRPEVQDEVFRIVQEAVSNVRHAAAGKVTVRLEAAGDTFRLLVEDDGTGIRPRHDSPTRGNGLGLQAMRERAAHIKGDLVFLDRPGGGTRVLLECPMEGAGQ